jgi:hypothetical protein
VTIARLADSHAALEVRPRVPDLLSQVRVPVLVDPGGGDGFGVGRGDCRDDVLGNLTDVGVGEGEEVPGGRGLWLQALRRLRITEPVAVADEEGKIAAPAAGLADTLGERRIQPCVSDG